MTTDLDLQPALRQMHLWGLADGDLGYAYWHGIAKLLVTAQALEARVRQAEAELSSLRQRCGAGEDCPPQGAGTAMRTIEARIETFISALRCDRCGKHARFDVDEGFNNFLQIGFDASWGSVLGDGTRVDIDLCHPCVKEILEPWLRLSDSDWARPSTA